MKNIVLLTIDTMRKDAWGCYSGKNPSLTPFLDEIQSHSMRFTRAYSGGPYTQAAFPGILSSSHYLEYGRTRGKCPKERVLISEVLQKAGYTTGAFHSNAYLCGFFGWNKGWNSFYDSMEAKVTERIPYTRAWDINKKAEAFLRRQDEDTPFFLWVHYMDVHEPYMPEEKYRHVIDPELNITEDEMFSIFKTVVLKRDVSDPAKVELAKKLYDAHTLEVDAAAHQLFDMIERNGFLKDSTVIIAADHGEEFGEHGGLSHDGKMFDELVRVPLCIYQPELAEGREVSTLVSTLDIPPTIAWLAGTEPDPSWQGKSLLPLKDYDEGDGVFGEAIDKHGPREVGDEKEVHYHVEGQYKIVYHELDGLWEVYDLENDPEEKHSIAGDTTITEYLMKKIIPRVGRYNK